MEYELVIWMQRMEEKIDLLLEKIRPDLFEKEKEKKK